MFKLYDYNFLSDDEDAKSLSFKDIGEFNLNSSSESDITEELRSNISTLTEINKFSREESDKSFKSVKDSFKTLSGSETP